MSRYKTVDDLVLDIRSLIDESNVSTVDNVRDILPSINRGQVYAFDILSKQYEDPLLLAPVLSTIAYGTTEIPLPENIFEDRIQKIEFENAGYFYECRRISYRDITAYETPSKVPVPAYYCLFGRTIRFLPAPDGSFRMRIWSLKEPDELVSSQGRVTATSVPNSFVVVENLGSDISASSDSLASYVNIIDGQTGEIKQTLQIGSILGSRITFRTSPVRTTVLNRTVSSALDASVQADDYVCSVKGTCVPFFAYPIYNFLVQYASNEMNRKLKNESTADADVLKKFEDQVKRSWSGREMTLRVKMRSQHWNPKRARRSRVH
jgi:hypothetical protein